MHTGKLTIAFTLACALVAGPALAEKGGKGKGKGQQNDQGQEDTHGKGGKSSHFGEPQRVVVREYYGESHKSGHCPPGLAKKHNGCMPPGQAKKWQMGKPLPRDVVYYEVPQTLVVKIGVPPSGYRYVRVAGDILMIAVGTAMVVDAIQDLGR